MSETLSAIVSGARKSAGKPALFVGLAGDTPRSPPARIGLRGVDLVEIGRATVRSFARSTTDGVDRIAIGLTDSRMSVTHARISRVGSTWAIEDLGSKNGTYVEGARITRHVLRDGDAILVGHTALVFRETGGEVADLDGMPPAAAPGLHTLSPSLAVHFAEAVRAAQSAVPVEIAGESGTGKELIARAVHALSGRTGRFVAVNCGALAGALLEGELFGHKKGAYTGADGERAGLVRSADGGTLFLDEVAELPASSQAALLRVLQEGEVVPLGGDRPIKVDVRLVTATHKDLAVEVHARRFRADLRARLLGVGVALPSLRERREDLGLLIAQLIGKLAPAREVAFAADAVAALYAYDWPLNIRELERALATALAVAVDRIELPHLPVAVRPGPPVPVTLPTDDDALRAVLAASVARHDGNLAAVARELGKDRTQIRRWMKRFDLDRNED